MKEITAETPLYTFTADFAGYTLLDSILGDMSAKTFMEEYEGDEKEAANLLDWLAPLARRGEGFWLTEKEAGVWYEETYGNGNGRDHANQTIEEFTVNSVLQEIKEAAGSE